RAMADEDRLAAPAHRDRAALRNLRDVDLNGREGEHVLGGIHLADERPNEGGRADRAHAACGHIKKIAARCAVRLVRHTTSQSPEICGALLSRMILCCPSGGVAATGCRSAPGIEQNQGLRT